MKDKQLRKKNGTYKKKKKESKYIFGIRQSRKENRKKILQTYKCFRAHITAIGI